VAHPSTESSEARSTPVGTVPRPPAPDGEGCHIGPTRRGGYGLRGKVAYCSRVTDRPDTRTAPKRLARQVVASALGDPDDGVRGVGEHAVEHHPDLEVGPSFSTQRCENPTRETKS
jgi:hypothetical protein